MDGSSSSKTAQVCGKMHLFSDQKDFACNIDMVPQVMKDVYENFNSMAGVVHDNSSSVADMIEVASRENDVGFVSVGSVENAIYMQRYLIGIIRCALRRCVSADGMINRSLVDLLTRIETEYFIDVSQLFMSAEPLDLSLLRGNIDGKFNSFRCMIPEIQDVILKASCLPSNFTFGVDLMIEYLNEAAMNRACCHKNHKELRIVLKNFVQSIKESTSCTSWEDICPRIEIALDGMALHSLFCLRTWEQPLSELMNCVDIDVSCVIIFCLVWQSNSTTPFTDDILVAYVDCFQATLMYLLEEKSTEQAKHQIQVIQDVLRLVRSLICDTPKHAFNQEELLHTKKNIDTALRNLGGILVWFFDEDKERFEVSNWLAEIFPSLLLPLRFFSFLSNETLTQYAYYFRHYQFELVKNEGTDMKSLSEKQSEFDEDLVHVARVVFYQWSEYLIDPEVLFNGRVEMVDVLRGLGNIIFLSLKNEVDEAIRLKMKRRLPHLLSKLEHVKIQLTRTISLAIFKRLCLQAPQTDLLGYLNFLLEDLEELRINDFDLKRDWKDQFQTIQQDLVVFRSFLHNIGDNGITNNSSRDLSLRVRNVAYSAEYIINAFAAGAFHICCRSFLLSDLIEQFNLIKEKANTGDIIIKGSSDVLPQELGPKVNTTREAIRISSRASVPQTDVVVGFEAETEKMMERLASDRKQLDVISIVGMPGIGKTTLAMKVYEHPYTVNHFQLRSWCVVSQGHSTKDLLLSILGTDESYPESSEASLGVLLHKKLMGRKYLIVLDDVWDINVFEYLKRFFPNDANGSRVVLTSRIISMGHDSNPLELHLLSDDESWDMLKQRVYPKGYPAELLHIGKEIARKCGGLPLAVVVVAGLLAKSDKDQDVWKEVAERLCLYTADDSQGQGMKALDLSYELLPDHLKPLFLYIGAFREDKIVSADELKWLWIAEGLIRKTKERSLEVQAEIYLMDLIDRSLVMIADRKSDGSVRAFRIHDLMRDMALSKARAENFLQHFERMEHLPEDVIYHRRVSACLSNCKDGQEHESAPTSSTADESSPRPPITIEDLSRLSIPSRLNSLFLSVSSIASTTSSSERERKKLELIFQNHKMLRIFYMDSARLHLSSLTNINFPANLRYISVQEDLSDGIPSSVFTLQNLETLILNSHYTEVPRDVWKLKKLRHLHIGSAIFCNPADDSNKLENLQTLSMPFLCGEETKLIGRFPNLQKLKCLFSQRGRNSSGWPRLESLLKLESLQVQWYDLEPCNHLRLSLPSTLKRLSLKNFRLKWNDISRFPQLLPNLEILKLDYGSVEDKLWDMGDVEFPKLKFLALRELNIKRWIASDDNFPRLQNLVLRNCYHLEEVPSGLADICSLEKIELLRCSDDASESAKRIQDEQVELGNDTPKVYISSPLPIADESGDEPDDESGDASSSEDLTDKPSNGVWIYGGCFSVKGRVGCIPLGRLLRATECLP